MPDEESVTTDIDNADMSRTWIWKSKYDSVFRAYEMAVEALEIIGDERGIDDPMFRQLSVMCRIVARSARSVAAEDQ